MISDTGYSQNFLKNSSIVGKIISKTNINKEDTVIEIGCGTGILTKELAKVAKDIIGIELDKNLYDNFKNKLNLYNNITLYNTDFFEFHLPKTSYKVFSNIPFDRTADICNRLFLSPRRPLEAYLFLQKESFYKFSGMYQKTQMSHILTALYDMKIIYNFVKDDFSPVPAVDVILASFIRRDNNLVEENFDLFTDFVSFLFNNSFPYVKKTSGNDLFK